MKLGILSDSHDNLPLVSRALALFSDQGVDTILHCGDIEGSDVVSLFTGLHAQFVFGNCDHDRGSLRRAIACAGATLHEPFGTLVCDGKEVAWLHGDDKKLLQELIASQGFDYLFHGHTHIVADRREGRTRVINPGALQRANPKTCAVLDPASGTLLSLEVAIKE